MADQTFYSKVTCDGGVNGGPMHPKITFELPREAYDGSLADYEIQEHCPMCQMQQEINMIKSDIQVPNNNPMATNEMLDQRITDIMDLVRTLTENPSIVAICDPTNIKETSDPMLIAIADQNDKLKKMYDHVSDLSNAFDATMTAMFGQQWKEKIKNHDPTNDVPLVEEIERDHADVTKYMEQVVDIAHNLDELKTGKLIDDLKATMDEISCAQDLILNGDRAFGE